MGSGTLTSGKVPVATGAQTIADGIITQSATTDTLAGTLAVIPASGRPTIILDTIPTNNSGGTINFQRNGVSEFSIYQTSTGGLSQLNIFSNNLNDDAFSINTGGSAVIGNSLSLIRAGTPTTGPNSATFHETSTAGTAIATNDVLWPDLTNHCLSLSNNNGSFRCLFTSTLLTDNGTTLAYSGTGGISTTGVNGGFTGTEGTGAGLTAGVGVDLLWPDSTAHRWKVQNNNGTAAQLVNSGVDVNTSDQVTAFHITGLVFSTPTLTVGTAGVNSGILALSGSASGTATLTAPATAGTVTNGLTVSNVMLGPLGSNAAPTYSFSASANSGMWMNSTTNLEFVVGGSSFFYAGSGNSAITAGSGRVWGWGNAVGADASNPDTGLSRDSAGVVDVGTGGAASKAGSMNLTNLTATGAISGATELSATRCAATGTAASPSVASCSAARAGAFSCATNASAATCTINTTAVTANSTIIVQESAAEGTTLSVTCNTSPTVTPAILLASRVAATSFTINMPTITVNPACFVYEVIN